MKISSVLNLGFTAQLVFAASVANAQYRPAPPKITAPEREGPGRTEEAPRGDAPLTPGTTRTLELSKPAAPARPVHVRKAADAPAYRSGEAFVNRDRVSQPDGVKQLGDALKDNVDVAERAEFTKLLLGSKALDGSQLPFNLLTETLKGMSLERQAKFVALMKAVKAKDPAAIEAIQGLSQFLLSGTFGDGAAISPRALEDLLQWGPSELAALGKIDQNSDRIYEEIETIIAEKGAAGVNEYVAKDLDPKIAASKKLVETRKNELKALEKFKDSKVESEKAQYDDAVYNLDVAESSVAVSEGIKARMKQAADGYAAYIKRNEGRAPSSESVHQMDREIASLEKNSSRSSEQNEHLAQLKQDRAAIAEFQDTAASLARVKAMGDAVGHDTAAWFEKKCGR